MKYVYKIVAAVMALAVIAVAVFMPLVHFSFESLLPSVLVTIGAYLKNDAATELLQNNNGELPTGITENIAIADLFNPETASVAEIIRSIGTGSENVSKALEPLVAPAITLLVIFALILICALVTAILALVVKNNRKVIYSAVTGIGLSLMLPNAFKAIAAPFLDGEITLGTISGSVFADLLGNVSALELTSTIWFFPVIFAGIIVWTVLYNMTLPANEKAERKRMLGEDD